MDSFKNTPIKDRALQMQTIYEFFRDNTSTANPLTVGEAYTLLKDKVRNETQVRDTIRKYNLTKQFLRIEEGNHVRFWFNSDSTIFPQKTKHPKLQTAPILKQIKPEIIVEKDRIIIEHPLCRVIVELKNIS